MGAHTLSVEEISSHKHVYYQTLQTSDPQLPNGSQWGISATLARDTEYTGGSQSHTHDFTGSTAQGSTLPMYYTLSYIMRCA